MLQHGVSDRKMCIRKEASDKLHELGSERHAGVHSVGTKPFGKHKRPVNQISETGQTLKCFDSLTSAAASVGMRPCNLYRVIKNNLIIKSCRWQYADMVGPMSKKKEESFRRQGVPGGVGRVEGRALIDKKRDRNGKSMRPFPDSAEVKDKSLHSLDCFDRFQVWLERVGVEWCVCDI